MSVLNFAEDFTRLVVRYTKAPSPNNEPSKDAIVPLNYDQMTNTIYQVFSALGIKDCNDNIGFLVRTPVNAIDVATPSAPVVSKINCKQYDDDDSRSDDILPAITDFGSSASDTSLTANEKEVKSSLNGLQSEKKFLSRSNPMICINNISRSDTFVCDKKQETNTDNAEDVFQENTETNYSISSNILQSLNEVQQSIKNIMTKVERIKKEAFPQMAKQTRRLSSSNGFSGLNYTSAMNKTNLSTKILRRSITSGTPTSSRSLSIEREIIFDRRKSTGESKCGIVTPGKLSESKKLGHSTSNLNLSQGKMSSDSIPKRTKNPKYAHVQSTIPKPTQVKKRVQQLQ